MNVKVASLDAAWTKQRTSKICTWNSKPQKMGHRKNWLRSWVTHDKILHVQLLLILVQIHNSLENKIQNTLVCRGLFHNHHTENGIHYRREVSFFTLKKAKIDIKNKWLNLYINQNSWRGHLCEMLSFKKVLWSL